tara:strand:+ start:3591 stop:4175 length:585 start_codon:yes stop_codon:yes gene_type:complete
MTKRKLDLYDIVVTVCSHYGLTEKEFFSKRRKRNYVIARHVSMYLMRNHGKINSYLGIKKYFESNGSISNHATVIYAVREMEDAMDGFDKRRKKDIEEISEKLCVFSRKYIDIHWFMKVNKGEKVHLKYGIDGEKTIIWEHKSLETRGNRVYVKGKIKKGEEWIDRDDMMYEENGFICAGDGHKVFSTGSQVLI